MVTTSAVPVDFTFAYVNRAGTRTYEGGRDNYDDIQSMRNKSMRVRKREIH